MRVAILLHAETPVHTCSAFQINTKRGEWRRNSFPKDKRTRTGIAHDIILTTKYQTHTYLPYNSKCIGGGGSVQVRRWKSLQDDAKERFLVGESIQNGCKKL